MCQGQRADRAQQGDKKTPGGGSKGTWLNPELFSHPSSPPGTRPGTLAAAHLLGDLARALDQLLLGVGIAGAALQGSSLGHQGSTAVTQLLHPALDVGADLQENTGVRQPEGTPCPGPPSRCSHLLILSGERSRLGLLCQLPVFVGQLVGQYAQFVWVGGGLGDLQVGEEQGSDGL